MRENLESQLRGWVEAVDEPISVEQVISRPGQHQPPQRNWAVPAAAAAVVLVLVAGLVAVLAGGNDSSDVTTVADEMDRAASTTTAVTSAPSTTVEAADPPTSTSPTTSSTTPATTSSTSPPTSTTTPRTGSVSAVVEPPSGEGCEGLRSETVWAISDSPDEITAPAGGSAEYVETVTNDGPTTCSMVFFRCPSPGTLFTSDGREARPRNEACPAVEFAPEDLEPGASRQALLTEQLYTDPGSYELRVRQYDGRVATLPIRLSDQIPACDPGTAALEQRPYNAGVRQNETAAAQLSIATAQQACTIRITKTELSLRARDTSSESVHVFVDESHRWYATGQQPILAEARFEPPINLPPGEYEGTITVHLESGETLSKPADLLVF